MPEDKLKCLLCKSTNIAVLERIRTSDIVRCYNRFFHCSIQNELKGYKELQYCRCNDCDLRFYLPAITGSETFYESLQVNGWYYQDDKPEYQSASTRITQTDKVLEVGCGKGAFARYVPTYNYTGLEFSGKAVHAAAAQGLHVVQESAESHAIAHANHYDVVCSFQMLEHVSGVHSIIEAFVTALKPCGLLVICVPSIETFIGMANNAVLNMPPHHVTHWTDEALRNISRIFPVELIELEHESVSDMHKSGYAELLAINNFIGRKQKTLDLSLTERLLRKLTYHLSKVLVHGLDDSRILPWGHSVIAVFRKSHATAATDPAAEHFRETAS